LAGDYPGQQRGDNFRVSFDDQTEEMWRMILDTILTLIFERRQSC
jgi:hypothetical protein